MYILGRSVACCSWQLESSRHCTIAVLRADTASAAKQRGSSYTLSGSSDMLMQILLRYTKAR